jgi:hypothetical protein
MLDMLVTHAIADREGKSPFFFSRFNFIRMRERRNTHYCFHCGGQHGFTPGANGEATNAADDNGKYNPMQRHDPVTHADAVIGDADKFDDVWDWLRKTKRPAKFPYIVNVPSIA